MAKVKIGLKEYELDGLTALDLKKMEAKKTELKLTEYDYSYFIMLYGVKKYNPDITMTLEEFQESFPLRGLKEKFVELGKIFGLDFKLGVGK